MIIRIEKEVCFEIIAERRDIVCININIFFAKSKRDD